MRVNAKVTFGTFHRESFGILQRRQPGFRQNAFLSDKKGRPYKMFDRNILTVQEGTMQFVQMFDRFECYITNIHIFTLPVRQTLAQICPLYNGVFFTYFDKTFFFVRKLEFNRTTVVTVSKMIQRKVNLKRKNKEAHCSGGC